MTVKQLHNCTFASLHFTLLHFCIVALLHPCTFASLHFYILALLHPCTFAHLHRLTNIVTYRVMFVLICLQRAQELKSIKGNKLSDQPTNTTAYRNISSHLRNVQGHSRHFNSCFLTSEVLKTQHNQIWDTLTDQQAFRKSVQMGQKNEEKWSKLLFESQRILKSALICLQRAQKCKKSKVGLTDRLTDRPADQQTDRHSDL